MKVTVSKKSGVNLGAIIRNAQELSMLSFESEEKREQSLIDQSSQMLTAFSIISVLLLMIAPVVISYLPNIPISYTLISLMVIIMFLIISMVLALLV